MTFCHYIDFTVSSVYCWMVHEIDWSTNLVANKGNETQTFGSPNNIKTNKALSKQYFSSPSNNIEVRTPGHIDLYVCNHGKPTWEG